MRAPAVAALTILASLAVSGVEARPNWKAPLERAGIRFISARELHALMPSGARLTLVDALDEVHFRSGHVSGTVSIKDEDVTIFFGYADRATHKLDQARMLLSLNTLAE